MRLFQIVDLDGCIADDLWRRHLINKIGPKSNDWFHEYHINSFWDKAVNLHEIKQPETIILTARPLRYRQITMQWLDKIANVKPAYILFRNDDDHRPSFEVKKEMVRALLDWNSYNIQLEQIADAIDDRENIVAMYRQEYGLAARVVRIGEEEHELG